MHEKLIELDRKIGGGKTLTERVGETFGIPEDNFHKLLVWGALVGCLSLGALTAYWKLNDEIAKAEYV